MEKLHSEFLSYHGCQVSHSSTVLSIRLKVSQKDKFFSAPFISDHWDEFIILRKIIKFAMWKNKIYNTMQKLNLKCIQMCRGYMLSK